MTEYEEEGLTLSEFKNLKVGQVILYTGLTKTFPCSYKIFSGDILRVTRNREWRQKSCPPDTRVIRCERLVKQNNHATIFSLYSDWVDPNNFELYEYPTKDN